MTARTRDEIVIGAGLTGLAVLIASAFGWLTPAAAQDDGCVSVVEQRLDGRGRAYWWGVQPDICVPRAGVAPVHIAAGTHYRVKSGGPVCLATNDGRTISGHPYLISGRDMAAAVPAPEGRPYDSTVDPRPGRYSAFIAGGYEVGIQPGTCADRGIRPCVGVCGDWLRD